MVLSFEKNAVLNSCFTHRYIITEFWSSSTIGDIYQLLWELWPFFNLNFARKMKDGFLLLSFEKITVSFMPESTLYHLKRYLFLGYISEKVVGTPYW